MATRVSPSESPTAATASERAPLSRRSQAILSLIVVALILGGAWLIGGRGNFAQIGNGGINRQLLPKVGDSAPDFTAYDLQGRPVQLSDFRGQPVWLNFWGSWCPPCRAEMPDIQAAYEQLAPDGLVLLAISLDERPQEAAAFAARNGATFTILTDQYRAATGNGYPIANFPTHIFIDRDGKIHRIVLSSMDKEMALNYGRDVIAAG